MKDTKQLDETFESFPKNLLEKLWKTLTNTLNVIFQQKYFLENSEDLSKEEIEIVKKKFCFLLITSKV